MRKSAILLPVFSLHGDYSIGTLGRPAYEFIDFLQKSRQYYWQILPLCPTDRDNSPYKSPGLFAFNEYYIDPEILCSEGLIKERDIAPLREENTGKVNYHRLFHTRMAMLIKAASEIDSRDKALVSFQDNNPQLRQYADYMAMTQGLATRESYIKFQFLFHRQWLELKKYANAKGVHIIGDLPIYPSKQSSDFFFHPENYLKALVAGCPPDAFSSQGQLWGNPVYNWKHLEKEGFSLWKERLSQASELFDAVRIDHFRGLYEYYCVREGEANACNGQWQKASGKALVAMIKKDFPHLKIIAEDLGFITEEVREFFKESGFPGMKILQFAFDSKDSEHLPHNYAENSVAYTGTHDNPTIKQWICQCPEEKLAYAMDYLGVPSVALLGDGFIRGVMASESALSVIPFQDWLGIGAKGRINTPGTVNNNWEYRISASDLTHNLSEKILKYTKLFKRTQEE